MKSNRALQPAPAGGSPGGLPVQPDPSRAGGFTPGVPGSCSRQRRGAGRRETRPGIAWRQAGGISSGAKTGILDRQPSAHTAGNPADKIFAIRVLEMARIVTRREVEVGTGRTEFQLGRTAAGGGRGAACRRWIAECLLLAGLPLLLQAGGPPRSEAGYPFITRYSPEDYGAETQNWAIIQDARGVVYFGNNAGVLEFDSRNWRLIPTAGKEAVRSLAIDERGRIYVGALGDIGYLRPGPDGELGYVSLVAPERRAELNPGDVLTVWVTRFGVMYQSAEAIYLLKDGKLTMIRPARRFHLGYLVHGEYYVRDAGAGLLRMTDRGLQLVPGSEHLAGDRIFTMLPASGGEILVGTRDHGWLIFSPAAPSRSAFRKARQYAALEKELAGVRITYCDLMPGGCLALGTIQSGLYLVNPEGRIVLHINKARGLANDAIHCLLPDRRNNLFLGLDVGVAIVETGSPFRLIDERSGINGQGSVCLKEPPSAAGAPGRLLAATLQGLFRRDDSLYSSSFRLIPGSMETWDLCQPAGQLLCAQNSGIMRLAGNELQTILKDRIVLRLRPVRNRPGLLLAGAFDGLMVLEERRGRWVFRNHIEGFSRSALDLAEDPDGSWWITESYGKGVLHVRLDGDLRRVNGLVRYLEADGLPAGSGNRVFPGRESVYFGTEAGIYRFDRSRRRFEPDPRFPETRGRYSSNCLIEEDAAGNVWFLGKELCGVYRRQGDGRFIFLAGELGRLCHLRLGDRCNVLDEENVLTGYQDGFIHYNPALDNRPAKPPAVLIRRVECPVDDTVIFAGSQSSAGQREVPAGPVLTYRRNQLNFNFVMPFFEGSRFTEYRTFLEGLDEHWSQWSRQHERLYTNLPEGHYTFFVKARTVYGVETPPAIYRFSVLPPWTRTVPAYLTCLLAGTLLVLAIAKGYNRHLRREKLRLEKLVAEKTLELKEASLRDPLTGLRNRRFIAEIVEPELRTFLSFKKYLAEHRQHRNHDAARSVFGIFLFDIDHFKMVNDLYGHEAGDRVLRQFSGILQSAIREDDFCIRWGGEEFLIILKKTDPGYLPVFARKIRDLLSDSLFEVAEGKPALRKTCSIGYASFPFYEDFPELLSYEQVIMLADLGLYYSKHHGRNLAVRITPGGVMPPSVPGPLFESLEESQEKGLLAVSAS